MNIKWKPLIISVLSAVAAGGLSGFVVGGDFVRYKVLELPAGSPPGWLFPVVWNILYLLMGVSAYLVWSSRNRLKESALFLYVVQLIVNFLWAPLFFSTGWYLFALLWLLFLLYLAAAMVYDFYRIFPLAAWLQLPYLLWLLYAAYLNLGVWILNRV